ncbi:MAG: alpha/beta hydrolase, partial [Nitrososphaeraceae archaeon]
DDNNYMPHGNALILAGKIPGAWLVQIKDAGHAVMDQYPAEISKILNTFLSTAGQNNVTSGNMTGGNMTGGNMSS